MGGTGPLHTLCGAKFKFKMGSGIPQYAVPKKHPQKGQNVPKLRQCPHLDLPNGLRTGFGGTSPHCVP